MIRRFVSTAVVAAVVATAALIPAISHAALFGIGSTASSSKVKNVKMTLKNRTSAPMDLMIEDKAITIAPNAEYALNVPEGTRIIGADKEVRVTVTRELAGTTCSFKLKACGPARARKSREQRRFRRIPSEAAP